MKKIAFAAALLAATAAAPAWAAPIPGLYNTGVDTNGAKLSGDNQVDPHYTVNGFTTFTTSNPAYVTSSTASFIAPLLDGQGGSATYTLAFNLFGFDLSTSTLSGSVAYDNTVQVALNGNVLFNDQPGRPGTYDAFQNLHAFTAAAGQGLFRNGVNTLTFTVGDYEAPTGLLVTNLAGTAGAVPEPATWAMMVAGFAMVGFGLRRRRSSVRVTYA